MWGPRPVTSVNPEGPLPAWRVLLWLTSDPLTEEGEASHLVVVLYLDDGVLGLSPDKLVALAAESVVWEQHARDC